MYNRAVQAIGQHNVYSHTNLYVCAKQTVRSLYLLYCTWDMHTHRGTQIKDPVEDYTHMDNSGCIGDGCWAIVLRRDQCMKKGGEMQSLFCKS